jgi:hypothetical protein
MRNEILFVLFILSLASAVQAETNYCHETSSGKYSVKSAESRSMTFAPHPLRRLFSLW